MIRKDKSGKTESRIGGQVTYREDTVVSRSTPLSPYKKRSLLNKFRENTTFD